MTKKHLILVIDDDANLRKTLSDILKAKGYEPASASCGKEGLSMAAENDVSVALIDLKLPDISGIEVLNGIKSQVPSTEAIILTGNATLDSAIEATNRGAFSYLQKPYDIDQLFLHVKRAIEKREAEEKIRSQSIRLQEMNEKLKAMYEEAKTYSLRDPLTGLANRRSLQIQIEKSCEAVKRYGGSICAIMLDIDHFKKYNDTRGHIEGDSLLITIADILLREVRNADYVFRYGGEEFLILLPGTDDAQGCGVAERLRKAIESGTEVTVSLGVARCDASAQEMIRKADQALYLAKQKGRNRVEQYPA